MGRPSLEELAKQEEASELGSWQPMRAGAWVPCTLLLFEALPSHALSVLARVAAAVVPAALVAAAAVQVVGGWIVPAGCVHSSLVGQEHKQRQLQAGELAQPWDASGERGVVGH